MSLHGSRLELFQLCEARSWTLVIACVLMDWEELGTALVGGAPVDGVMFLNAIQVISLHGLWFAVANFWFGALGFVGFRVWG
jgi:hypothetical protein